MEKNKKGYEYDVWQLDKKQGNTEDVTKYGEFVSSYFAWITLEQQKKRAEEMQNMTKK